MPQSHCKLNDLNWCCLNPLLECMAAPLPCSNSSTHMTRQSAKFTIWAGQHSPTTGGFTCQVFFSERQDYKVLAASRLRTDQEVFYYQTNYISSVFLKKNVNNQVPDSENEDTTSKLIMEPDLMSSQCFYSKLQCFNELIQLPRSSLHVRDFELSHRNLPKIWVLQLLNLLKQHLLPALLMQHLEEQERTVQVKQSQISLLFYLSCHSK